MVCAHVLCAVISDISAQQIHFINTFNCFQKVLVFYSVKPAIERQLDIS